MTDLINNIVKEGRIPDDWRDSWCLCKRGKVIHLRAGHTELLSYWTSRCRFLSVGKENQMSGVN